MCHHSSANADNADAAVLIPASRIGGNAYVSLDDLAEILGGRLHPYPSKGKIGLRKGGDLIVFTPFSSVVTVNDVGYRLPLETRYHDSEALYVPSDAILPLLARTLPGYPRITPVEKPVQAVRASVRETRQPIPRTPVPRAKVDPERWTIDTIIIDPGHGGRDPGALGKRGTREKDIVSLHCNASRSRRARGFEVYFLSEAKTDEAAEVARRENAVLRLEEQDESAAMDEIEGIQFGLLSTQFLKESQDLAAEIRRVVVKSLRPLPDRGVRQANFYVMRGTMGHMPSVLVEMGFISNPGEESQMQKRTFQSEMAEAIFSGIQNFKRRYERQLTQN